MITKTIRFDLKSNKYCTTLNNNYPLVLAFSAKYVIPTRNVEVSWQEEKLVTFCFASKYILEINLIEERIDNVADAMNKINRMTLEEFKFSYIK